MMNLTCQAVTVVPDARRVTCLFLFSPAHVSHGVLTSNNTTTTYYRNTSEKDKTAATTNTSTTPLITIQTTTNSFTTTPSTTIQVATAPPDVGTRGGVGGYQGDQIPRRDNVGGRHEAD
ncbi:uncharacterized protein LOC121865611 [Homarus americanus]|nr:uncharacterized protein LOC121865611 [Homarus americanus]